MHPRDLACSPHSNVSILHLGDLVRLRFNQFQVLSALYAVDGESRVRDGSNDPRMDDHLFIFCSVQVN